MTKLFKIFVLLLLIASCKSKNNQKRVLSNNFPFQIDTILKFNTNFNIYIQESDSISTIGTSSIQKNKDSISKLYDNSHRQAIELEKLMIQKYNKVVKKDSLGLHLKLNNGKWVTLVLNLRLEELDLNFENYFEHYGYFLVRAQWGEGNGYKIINAKTGKQTSIIGAPYFSKNGKYIISINMDLIAGYSPNGFEFLEIRKDSLLKLGSYHPVQWGPYNAKWINNNEVILKNKGFEWTQYRAIDTSFYVKIKLKTVANTGYN